MEESDKDKNNYMENAKILMNNVKRDNNSLSE